MRTVLAVACALGLAACGSSSDGKTTASSSSSNDRDTARLKLQECLRDQGIDVPAPGDGPRMATGAARQKVQAALQGPCKKDAQGAFGTLSEEDRQEMQDAFAKFAACMRKHGVDLPDMTPGQGPPAAAAGINRNSPAFRKAVEACEDLRPQRPGDDERGAPS
ncbi:MAG TPA: hypothetical protein VFZ89_12490 [Solirubrobacteraceae bacterium]